MTLMHRLGCHASAGSHGCCCDYKSQDFCATSTHKMREEKCSVAMMARLEREICPASGKIMQNSNNTIAQDSSQISLCRKEACFHRGLNTGPCAYETHALPLSYESRRFIVTEGEFLLLIKVYLTPSYFVNEVECGRCSDASHRTSK